MLGYLEIENFKSFKGSHSLTLKPITLLFGKNSSGKSAILQCINLVKRTFVTEGVATLVTTDDFLDLGTFNDLITDHDLNNSLKIKLVPMLFKKASNSSRQIMHGIEFSFRSINANQALADEISITSKFYPEKILATFKRVEMTPKLSNLIKRDSFMKLGITETARYPRYPHTVLNIQNLMAYKFDSLNKDHMLWVKAYQSSQNKKDKIIKDLSEMQDFLKNRDSKKKLPKHFPFKLDKIAKAIKFYQSDYSIGQFINRIIVVHRSLHLFYSGIRIKDFIASTGHSHPPEYMMDAENHPFPMFSELIRYIDINYEEFFEKIKMLGAYRLPPKRYYSETGSTSSFVGFSGENLAYVLSQTTKIKKEVNDWLNKLEIPYTLDIRTYGEDKDLFQLRLIDKRKKGNKKHKSYNLTDVGFGVSQLLPIIVQCLQGNHNILTIMEPEAHLQPGLQANLGELFVRSSMKNHNQLIIETHSEHIILRIQKLVRDGIIDHEDVSINYISTDNNGYSNINHLRWDESGDFIDYWPGGFFTERLSEIV